MNLMKALDESPTQMAIVEYPDVPTLIRRHENGASAIYTEDGCTYTSKLNQMELLQWYHLSIFAHINCRPVH